MNKASLLRLVSLAAIWGASFLFMRIVVPVVGPTLLIFVRVVLAAIFLAVVGSQLRQSLHLKSNWQHYLILGAINSAIPFLLFAYAAEVVSASLLAILNATAPIWGAVIGALWSRTPLSGRAQIGLLLGLAGVAILAGVEMLALPEGGAMAIAAALGAALCYGIASIYARSAKSAPTLTPLANAHGSMWAATLLILPGLFFTPMPSKIPGTDVIAAVLILGVICSGVAYLLYFRLIADLGATSALTVTFLIPVFGVLWGRLFLGEAIGWHTLAGTVLVLLGTGLTTGFSLTSVFSARKPQDA